MFTNGMRSSLSVEWSTPKELMDRINTDFGPFDLDPCCTKETAKALNFYTKEDNGLLKEWEGRIWINPPYGREIKHWVKKAYEYSLSGGYCVCLVPARTDAKWFQDYCMKGQRLFLRGRVKFENNGIKAPAPFPSVIVVFSKEKITKELTQFKEKLCICGLQC